MVKKIWNLRGKEKDEERKYKMAGEKYNIIGNKRKLEEKNSGSDIFVTRVRIFGIPIPRNSVRFVCSHFINGNFVTPKRKARAAKRATIWEEYCVQIVFKQGPFFAYGSIGSSPNSVSTFELSVTIDECETSFILSSHAPVPPYSRFRHESHHPLGNKIASSLFENSAGPRRTIVIIGNGTTDLKYTAKYL